MTYELKLRAALIDPYESLANAIIAQAYWDYVNADFVQHSDPVYQRKKILEFFRSDYLRMLTDTDPEYIIKRMLEEAKPLRPRRQKRSCNHEKETI